MTALDINSLAAFASGFDEPWLDRSGPDEYSRRCGEHEAQAIEQALARWIGEAGVTPEEFGRHYGYTVERHFEGMKFSVTVRPVLLSELARWPGEFPQPAAPSTDQS